MKSGEIAKIIVKSIGAAGLVIGLAAFPGIGKSISIIHKFSGKNKNKSKIRSSAHNLRKKGYIEYISNNGRSELLLTKKGRSLLNKFSFEDMKMKPPQRWDGYWRIITFDIPEKKRRARVSIHWKLKDLGFYPLQKSIFVYPYDCEEEINFIGDFFFARKHIYLIIAKSFDNEERVKRHFGLC